MKMLTDFSKSVTIGYYYFVCYEILFLIVIMH